MKKTLDMLQGIAGAVIFGAMCALLLHVATGGTIL